MKNYLLIVLVLLSISGCAQLTRLMTDQLTVQHGSINADLPSGSGMMIADDMIYVVGDDSPYLFQLDPAFKITAQYPLQPVPSGFHGRIAASIKPDYESMGKVEWNRKQWLLIFGSGSGGSFRDNAVLLSLKDDESFHYTLEPLYYVLYRASGMSGKQKLNIEGLALSDNQMFIFNRGNQGENIIFAIDKFEALDFLRGQSDAINSLKTITVTLPIYQGTRSTFSGADYWPEIDSIVFSASMETSKNAMMDGKVLGSYVGIVPIAKLQYSGKIDLTADMLLVQNNEKIIPTKIESVAIKQSDEDSVNGYLVSDNDDGMSQFFTFTLYKE